MHALMHDLAQEVAGGGSLLLCTQRQHVDDHILHVSLKDRQSWEAPLSLFAGKRIRSLLLLSFATMLDVNDILSSFCFLHALDLVDVRCESLPNSLGNLKHLRYLRLGCSILSLLNSIRLLQNLQTLDLTQCCRLKQLPSGFGELINRRHLRNRSCEWIDMCPNFGKIVSLETLDVFTMADSTGLNALAGWDNLARKLEIHFHKLCTAIVQEAVAANLKHKKLTSLVLSWLPSYEDSTIYNERVDDMVLECLQLPRSLKSLKVMKWKGFRLPQWGMEELLNLVSLEILLCHRCQYLPSFSRLPHLRFLPVNQLVALEYFEIEATSISAAYFPSLEQLELHYMSELQGWSAEDICEPKKHEHYHRYFPRLSELTITNCPKLISMPLVPKLQNIWAQGINGKLLQHVFCVGKYSPSSLPSPPLAPFPLSSVLIDAAYEFDSLSFIDHLSLESLGIHHCDQLINFTVKSLNSLRTLCITGWHKLRDISRVLSHLFALEELEIAYCSELCLKDFVDAVNDDDDGNDGCRDDNNRAITTLSAWKALKSLRCLNLHDLWKVESLPKGLCFLTALQELRFIDIPNLTALPEQIKHLNQLCRLYIRGCPILTTLSEGMENRSQLLELELEYFSELTALPSWIGHLTQLQRLREERFLIFTSLPEQIGQLIQLHELRILNCPTLTTLPNEIVLLTQLRKLSIDNCAKLTALPMETGNLTQLIQLGICGCPEFSSLPESFSNLYRITPTSHSGCPELVARCQRLYGECWPLIRHIPFVFTSVLARLKSY